jgi:predicted nucleic acid-binding protein
MRTLFVDASYFIALLNPKDDLHHRAIIITDSIDDCVLVTTEMVLTEVLNFFAERGATPRRLAANLVRRLRRNPNTDIVAQTTALFEDGFELYRGRPDKEWSLTDCVSFRVMEKDGIGEALTFDHNFEQAGFVALMRPSLMRP